jgi:hypothetical protein
LAFGWFEVYGGRGVKPRGAWVSLILVGADEWGFGAGVIGELGAGVAKQFFSP